MIFELDFREDDTGGAVVPGRLLSLASGAIGEDAGRELAAFGKVTFVTHGFNVDRRDGRRRIGHLAKLLASSQDGALVAMLWPGDHSFGFLSFPFEGEDADETGLQLARFVDDTLLPGTQLNFVTHSLGARAVLECLKRLRERFEINQLCLTAAAIDNDSLARESRYRRPVEQAHRVAVLSSVEDEVLSLAYPLGDLFAFFFSTERDLLSLALGFSGPAAPRGVTLPATVYPQAIDKARDSDHGDYLIEPRADPDPGTQRNRESATAFMRAVLSGESAPRYT